MNLKSSPKQLVQLIKGEPRCSTWDMKDGFGVEHRALVKLIKKYRYEFEEFGYLIASAMQKFKGDGPGRPVQEY